MSKQGLISICMPTLNARRFLSERLDTLLSQTFTDWEIIVCDSYSNDGTWEFLQKFNSDSRIRLYQVPKEGLYAGWNECLRRARGEFVYFATADDTCHPVLLEKMVASLCRPVSAHAQRATDIAVCNFDYIDEEGRVIKPVLPPAGAFYGDSRYVAHTRSGYVEFLVHMLIGTSWTTMTSVLFRRSLLEKTGLFRTDCGELADRFWAYKAAVHSDTAVVPETLATWRQHVDQGSFRAAKMNVFPRMQALRRLWRATVETLDECSPWLPAQWTRDSDYRDKLLWAERRHYFDQYHLTKTALRYRPGEFVSGVMSGLIMEPSFVMRRLLSGLVWAKDDKMSEVVYLRNLMRLWSCESM